MTVHVCVFEWRLHEWRLHDCMCVSGGYMTVMCEWRLQTVCV